jgi:alanine racemase
LRAVIDTAALRHNLSRVREVAPGCRVIAVVKANAYGHGLLTVARALEGADAFAVARLEEAVTLREAGCQARIVLLEGIDDASGLEVAARLSLEPFVHEPFQVGLLEAWRGPQQIRAWLKVDTGMHRLRFSVSEVPAAAARLEACRFVAQPIALVTHLADAECGEAGRARAQLAAFAEAVAGRAGERSIANSAGLIAWPEARADWVRPGIMLYGISPFADRTGAELGLEPAMTLETRVIALKDVAPGERVGYGGTWVAERPSRVAVAAAGYGDGYPRSATSGTPVTVGGGAAVVAGRPSMDMLTIDVTGLSRVAIGDRVELWGREVPVERVAAAAGTIAYELTCRVGRRVSFVTRDA